MFSECDEVAGTIAINLRRRDLPETFDEALAIVKAQMPDESSQIQDNVAESLLARGKFK